jgi:hypothetical protein
VLPLLASFKLAPLWIRPTDQFVDAAERGLPTSSQLLETAKPMASGPRLHGAHAVLSPTNYTVSVAIGLPIPFIDKSK